MISRLWEILAAIASILALGFMFGRKSKQGEVDAKANEARREKWQADEMRAREHINAQLAERTAEDLIRSVGATGSVQRDELKRNGEG